MKIVTWNCNGAFRKKFHLIEGLDADVLAIQECEDPAQFIGKYSAWAKNYLWTGTNKNKGIGVFIRNDYFTLNKLDYNDDGLQLFLPCRINDSVILIAVWTKQSETRAFRYIGQVWKYLQLHKNKLEHDPIVICGDFNSNVCWDKRHRPSNHSDVVRELGKIGIHSLYHELMKENQGEESIPTLYMHRKLAKPYHIDYAFISKDLLGPEYSFEVGRHEIWLQHSDHMPLIFSL